MIEESAENLSDVIDPSLTVKLNGKDYKLSPLTPFDFAEAERHYLEDNLDVFLNRTRTVKGVILPDSTRGIAIAAILNKAVGLNDIIETFRGQVHLIYLSLKKLMPEITLESMAQIDAVDLKVLDLLVAHITGIKPIKEVDSTDPLGMTPKTFTPEGSDQTSPTGEGTFHG